MTSATYYSKLVGVGQMRIKNMGGKQQSMSTQLTTAFRNSCKGRIRLISRYVISCDVQFLGLVAMGKGYAARCPGVRVRLCACLGACVCACVRACVRLCVCAGEREWISMRSLAL